MAITITRLKSKEFLDIEHTDWDDELTELLNGVVSQVIDYLDHNDITTLAEIPATAERAVLKQMAYEWRRRNDLGLNSVSFPDGNISKFETDELLPEVRKVLDRHRYLGL